MEIDKKNYTGTHKLEDIKAGTQTHARFWMGTTAQYRMNAEHVVALQYPHRKHFLLFAFLSFPELVNEILYVHKHTANDPLLADKRLATVEWYENGQRIRWDRCTVEVAAHLHQADILPPMCRLGTDPMFAMILSPSGAWQLTPNLAPLTVDPVFQVGRAFTTEGTTKVTINQIEAEIAKRVPAPNGLIIPPPGAVEI